jgi:hypothetical protein
MLGSGSQASTNDASLNVTLQSTLRLTKIIFLNQRPSYVRTCSCAGPPNKISQGKAKQELVCGSLCFPLTNYATPPHNDSPRILCYLLIYWGWCSFKCPSSAALAGRNVTANFSGNVKSVLRWEGKPHKKQMVTDQKPLQSKLQTSQHAPSERLRV